MKKMWSRADVDVFSKLCNTLFNLEIVVMAVFNDSHGNSFIDIHMLKGCDVDWNSKTGIVGSTVFYYSYGHEDDL